VRFDGDARSYGFVGVASRHGQHTAVVVIERERSCVTILVHVVGSFYPFESDLSFRTPASTDPTFGSGDSDRRALFFDTIEEIDARRFCGSDASRVRVLPSTCFASIPPDACLQCLVQLGLEEGHDVEAGERAWFGNLLDGVAKGSTGITRALENTKRPHFRVVFQRAQSFRSLKNDEVDDDACVCASVDAIQLLNREAAYDTETHTSIGGDDNDDDDDGVVATDVVGESSPSVSVCRPMSSSTRMRSMSSSSVWIHAAPAVDSFFERVASLVLENSWERRLAKLYIASASGGGGGGGKNGSAPSAQDVVLRTLELFEPPIAILHRCKHSHALRLHRRNTPTAPVDVCEADRVFMRHGIVVAWDEHHDDVFRAVPSVRGRQPIVRLSERAAHAAIDEEMRRGHDSATNATDAPECTRDRTPECASSLKRLRAALG
jgi:hypothetical protein